MESISVIIPVFNSANTIKECVDSVLNELVSNNYTWEIILVDDCSEDGTLEIMLKTYTKADIYADKIHIVKLDTNSGVAVARNKGLKLSKGTIIAFNDSDDLWLPGKVKLQMQYLENNPLIEMVSGVFEGDRVDIIRKVDSDFLVTIKDQVFKNYFSPQCVMFRRTVLEKVGLFHPQMRYAEEGFFFNKMVFYCKCVLLNIVVTKPLTNKKRWGDSGLSGNLWRMEKGELFNIFMAYKSRFIPLHLFFFSFLFSLLKYLRRVLFKYYYESKK